MKCYQFIYKFAWLVTEKPSHLMHKVKHNSTLIAEDYITNVT